MTILVTGASGFLGGRFVERLLLEKQARVRVMLRSVGRASRIASLPFELHRGDVTDRAAFKEAATGCDAVIHCASRIEPGVAAKQTSTFLGVQTAAQVCADVGARLVHISSASVYGVPETHEVDEASPLRPRHKRDCYALAKIEAEKFLKSFAKDHAIRAAIIQPTIIYGPYSEEWTLAPLAMLRGGNVAMPQSDRSVCNAVYVDDVVAGALLALDACDDSCQSYLINGNDLPTWSEFLSRHAALGTKGKVVPVPMETIDGIRQEASKGRSLIRTGTRLLREHREVRSALLSTSLVGGTFSLLQRCFPKRVFESLKGRLTGKGALSVPVIGLTQAAELPLRLPPPHFLELASQQFRFSSAKAQKILGYVPQYSVDLGMEMVGAWARWSRLLP